MKDYHSFLAEVLIPEAELKARIAVLGAEISRDYAGKEIMAICILRGGVMFLTDLIRCIEPPVAIDFMGVFVLWNRGARIVWSGPDQSGLEDLHCRKACIDCGGYYRQWAYALVRDRNAAYS